MGDSEIDMLPAHNWVEDLGELAGRFSRQMRASPGDEAVRPPAAHQCSETVRSAASAAPAQRRPGRAARAKGDANASTGAPLATSLGDRHAS